MAKGQDLMVEVLSLPKWRERSVRVSLYGDGPSRRVLQSLADYLGTAAIHVASFEKDIEALWSRHHALLMPSRCEGLPLAVVEAMLCGRPVIVTDVPGNAELIDDNETGFVASAPTVAALDEAMERAWQQRHRLKEIGAEATRRVRTMVPPDPAADFASLILSAVAHV